MKGEGGLFRSFADVVLKYIGLTTGVFLTGAASIVITFLTLPQDRTPEGISLFFLILGSLLIFGSPIISIFWLGYVGYQNSRKRAALEKAKVLLRDNRIAEEQAREKENRTQLETARLRDCVRVHSIALARNLRSSIKFNDYGAIVEDNRWGALAEFFASIDLDTTLVRVNDAIVVVEHQLKEEQAKNTIQGFAPNNIPLDGFRFEEWVAASLKKFGWIASVTSRSNDQGIDVIAIRDGKTLGLQCKLYNSAIGNKAIQEAHAGKSFHDLDRAAVITNNEFTPSAKALANSTGVLLLNHTQIPEVYELCFP